MDFVAVAKIDERAGHCPKVAHPKEVKMTEACPVEITFPQLIKNLTTDLPGVAVKAMNLNEITINDLALFSPQGSEYRANKTNDVFHHLESRFAK
jgi:hypothetical protein